MNENGEKTTEVIYVAHYMNFNRKQKLNCDLMKSDGGEQDRFASHAYHKSACDTA